MRGAALAARHVKVLQLLAREVDAPRATILAMACISGTTNGLLIALINAGSAQLTDDRLKVGLVGAYIGAFLVYVLAQHFAMTRTVAAVEQALLGFRLRIMDKVRRSELRFIETHGGASTYAPLTLDANLISQSSVMLVSAAQSALTLLFAGLYLGYLSPVTLVVTLCILLLLIPMVSSHGQQTRQQLGTVAAKDARFFEGFTGILSGFKELKLNRQENDALFAHLQRTADDAYRLKVAVNARQAQNILLSYSIYFIVLLAAVFVVPAVVPETSDTIHKVTATVLFMMTPIWPLVIAIPVLARAGTAIASLYDLEERIDRARDPAETEAPAQPLASFERIEIEGLGFHYLDRDGHTLFAAGPFDLTLRRGELLFIVGGNGSGKSTLLKLLTGLYRSQRGHILLDGRRVGTGDYARYRTLFTSVFTDFHLFRRLYGLPDADPSRVDPWLAEMELADKTRYTDRGFTNLNLSTGQKKRLAIIAAVLKQRPICIFDEPAADQDPSFRRRFYEQILPKLKAMGRTIVVVSHDDQYFHLADRVVQLRDGRIQEPSADSSSGDGR